MSDKKFYHGLFPEGIYIIPETDHSQSIPNSPGIPVKAEGQASEMPAETSNEGTQEKPPAATPIYKGENKKQVLVMYSGELTDDQEAFLLKVLAAVSLTLTDIALADHARNEHTWKEIEAGKILVFGCDPVRPPGSDTYKPLQIQHQEYLFADSLEGIMEDRSRKGQLWNGLKQMFGL